MIAYRFSLDCIVYLYLAVMVKMSREYFSQRSGVIPGISARAAELEGRFRAMQPITLLERMKAALTLRLMARESRQANNAS